MIKIAVCDDEKKDRDDLEKLIRKYLTTLPEKCILRLFESGEQFLKSGFVPDILFLDIIMHEKDGIQVGAEIKRKNPNVMIIYTTNLNEKMAVAFNQIHSFGYLIKPIAEKELFQMMSDALIQTNHNSDRDTVTFLSENNTSIRLRVKDIYYFEYCDRRVKIFTTEDTYICKEKINDIAKRMEQYGFAMSHQSFVVNLYYVDRISDQMLIMKNGAKVYLAQKRTAAFRKQLMQIAKNSINNGGSKK